jgi:hypothetical protein
MTQRTTGKNVYRAGYEQGARDGPRDADGLQGGETK